jgi:hypothetical protein
LKVCCAGLLELSSLLNSPFVNENPEVAAWNPQAKYVHRTAADFLAEAQTSLPTNSSIEFGPNSALLRGYISQLKSHSIRITRDIIQLEERIGTILSLAYVVEKENAPLSVECIDDILTTLFRYVPAPPQKAHRANSSPIENYWPREKLIWAVRASLFRYLTVKLGLPQQLPRSPCGRSYLYYALSAEHEHVNVHRECISPTLVSSERIIAFLLPHSSRTDIEES